MKKICFFGSYSPLYPRNVLVIKGLKKLRYQVIECNDQSGGIKHYFNLIKKFIKNCRDSDIIFLGVLGHYDTPLAWIIAKLFRKKLIIDAFYSLFDAYIEDRKIAKKISFKAFRFWVYDYLATRLSNKIILDTRENINYFIKRYKAREDKFFELPVTADNEVFKFIKRSKKQRKQYTIGFYGSFLPLHGVDLIIDTMHIMRNSQVNCKMVGSGPGLIQIKRKVYQLKLFDKVSFEKNISYEKLPAFFKRIDLFLAGPFGKTPKANRVLPAKAVEALASGIPTIIKETKTTKRLLKNYKGKIIWLSKNNPKLLGSLILHTLNNYNQSINEEDYFKSSNLSFDSFTNNIAKIVKEI